MCPHMIVCICVCVHVCVSFPDVLSRGRVDVTNSSTAGESTTISQTPLNIDNRWHTLSTSQDAFRGNGIAL